MHPSRTAVRSVPLAMLFLLMACATDQPAGDPSPAATPPEATSDDQPTPDANGVADFYEGNTVRIVVGFGAGGGYDTFSRTIASHLGSHIPGNPNVIVENMTGAGSLVAANAVYNTLPKDGTVIGNFIAGLVQEQAFGNESVEFEASEFVHLGIPARDGPPLCLATRASGITDLAQTIGPDGETFVVGGDAPGNTFYNHPLVIEEALNANIELVGGYDGTAEIILAMEQGELDGMCGLGWELVRASYSEQIESGDIVIISQFAEERVEDLPNVTSAFELVEGEEARQLLFHGVVGPSEFHRLYVVAPEVPEDRAEALKQAFADTMVDPEFLADAEQQGLTITPLSSEEAAERVEELLNVPPEILERLSELIGSSS